MYHMPTGWFHFVFTYTCVRVCECMPKNLGEVFFIVDRVYNRTTHNITSWTRRRSSSSNAPKYQSLRKQDEQEILKHRQETLSQSLSTLHRHITCAAHSPLVFWFVLAVFVYILSPGSGSSTIAIIINIEINTMILVYFTLPACHLSLTLPRSVCSVHDVQPDLKPILRCIYEFLLWTLCVWVCVVHNIFRISKRVQRSKTGRAKRVCMRAIHVILKSLRGALQLYTEYTVWGLRWEWTNEQEC